MSKIRTKGVQVGLWAAACLLSACGTFSPPKSTLNPKKIVHITQSYLCPDHKDVILWKPSKAKDNLQKPVLITTGSLLGYSSKAAAGKIIRFASRDRKEGLSHVGMALVAYPSEILRLVQASAKFGGLSTRTPEYPAYQLHILYEAYPYLKKLKPGTKIVEPLEVFVFEAVSDAKLVRKDGIHSCVLISPLHQSVDEYPRDVCVRALKTPLKLEDIQATIIQELGICYELKKIQLARAPFDANEYEDGSSWFCSELVAHIYKTSGVLDASIGYANNVVPKEFASYNKEDVLRGKADDEQWIKRVGEDS